jgi:hypothetical protein
MKNILLTLLAALCVYFAFNLTLKNRQIISLKAQSATLEEDIKRQISFTGRQITHRYRRQDKVLAQTHYLPPEGAARIKQDNAGAITLYIKNKGLTFKPFAGVFVNAQGAAGGLAGARLFYYNRLGLGAAWAQKDGPALYLDRRLDDLLPFTQNTALFFFTAKNARGIGLSVYI